MEKCTVMPNCQISHCLRVFRTPCTLPVSLYVVNGICVVAGNKRSVSVLVHVSVHKCIAFFLGIPRSEIAELFMYLVYNTKIFSKAVVPIYTTSAI